VQGLNVLFIGMYCLLEFIRCVLVLNTRARVEYGCDKGRGVSLPMTGEICTGLLFLPMLTALLLLRMRVALLVLMRVGLLVLMRVALLLLKRVGLLLLMRVGLFIITNACGFVYYY